MTLTADELKEVLSYDPDTGVFCNRVRRSTNAAPGSIAGGMRVGGYERISIQGRRYYSHRLAWLYVYGRWPDGEIDHANGIRNDNRICNLRVASRSQNLQNQRIRDANTSGYKGVSLCKIKSKWKSQIGINGKMVWLGWFETAEAAHAAYVKAAHRLHGEFALP